MSSVDKRIWQSPLRPYVELFQVPGAWRFSAAGLIGRMPWSMLALGTVLLISAATGRYGTAGAVASVGSLGYAFVAPLVARLVDRHGQRRVLVPVVTVFAVTTAALIAAVQLRAPTWTWFVLGALSGSTMQTLGPMVRARWSALLTGTPQLHTAFSFESVADELCFIVGPAAVTLLATEVHPDSGVGVAAVLGIAGTLWLAAQRRTEPPVVRPAGDAGRARGVAAPGLVVLVPVYILLGGMFAAIDLSTLAFAQQFGHKPLAGLILAAQSFGSAAGGLWYGSRHWHSSDQRRFAITLCLTAAGVATFCAMPNLVALTCVIYLSGMTIAPTLITGFSLLEAQGPPGRRTEAMTWVTSGIGIGASAAASVVGFIIDAHGARAGYLLAAACGIASAATGLLGHRRLSIRQPSHPVAPAARVSTDGPP